MSIRRKTSTGIMKVSGRVDVAYPKRLNRGPMSIRVSGSCTKSEAEALVETIRSSQSATASQEKDRAVAQKVKLMKATAIGRALLDAASSDELAAKALSHLLQRLPDDKRALFQDEISVFIEQHS
jgi:hypothetical protein